jgi:hypothetical protein
MVRSKTKPSPDKVNTMTETPDSMRRRPLADVPIVSASLALGSTAADAATEAPAPVDPKQPLFNTTDHVATYYKRARS